MLDFSLKNYVIYHKNKNTSCVLRFYQPDINKLRKNGVAEVDENDVITSMVEKPNNPKSNWTISPFYIIKKDDLVYVGESSHRLKTCWASNEVCYLSFALSIKNIFYTTVMAVLLLLFFIYIFLAKPTLFVLGYPQIPLYIDC